MDNEPKVETKPVVVNDLKPIVSAIIIAGVLIAGAILLKGSGSASPSQANNPTGNNPTVMGNPAPITASDRTLGNPKAKVTVVMYEDFQCPFCGQFFKDSEANIRDTYEKDGTVQFVYRDFAFLGAESERASEAAMCAEDQGKFWDYHDYLFTHQNGENQGAFTDVHLEAFAQTMGLNTTTFNQCLSSNKYMQAVADSKTEATAAGVTGTPKGYIVVGGKTVSTIEGAEPFAQVKSKIDAALK